MSISLDASKFKLQVIFIVILVSFSGLHLKAAHFTPNWTGGALDPMTITVTQATLNGVAIGAGDEIGIFDGSDCVGAYILIASINPSNPSTFVYVTCAKDDPGTPAKDGYTPGNTISYKVWKQSTNMESSAVAVTFPYAPMGQFTLFTVTETAIVGLAWASGAQCTLTVTPPNQLVSSIAGVVNFIISTTCAWTANSDQTWCTVTPSGTGNGIIIANYLQNTTSSQRTASITVTVAGLLPVVVTITQAANGTTFAPVTTAATKGSPYNSPVTIPVTVNGFNDITAISLRLDYDPAVLTFLSSSNPASQLNGLMVNDLHVSASLHKVMITWSDLNPQTLAENAKIVDLNFTYITGTTALTWNNTSGGGSECEYADANGDPLTDIPSALFYVNGEVHWQPGYLVTGIFKYNNTAYTALDNVKVVLTQGSARIDSVATNSTGNYTFPSVPNGTYKVLAYSTKPWSSVNATDAIKVQRHFAGIEIITEPVRLLAGDVNLSNSINATDAIKIKRRFSGLDTSFTRGNWTFAKPTIGGDTIILNGTAIAQDFYGLCVGDVNGSNVPEPGKSYQSSLILTQDNELNIAPGQEFELPIRIQQEVEIGAISLVLNFPSEFITVMDVSVKQGTLLYSVIGNQIRLAWSEIESMVLHSFDPLINLRLKVSLNTGPRQPLSFSLNNESELADEAGLPLPDVKLTAPFLKVGNLEQSDVVYGLFVFPNPVKDRITIEFELLEVANVAIDLYDPLGRQINSLCSGQKNQGKQIIEAELGHLAPGAYTLKCSFNGTNLQVENRKIIVQ